MLESSRSIERVILVHISINDINTQEDLAEFIELSKSSGGVISKVITVIKNTPEPKYFLGKGKAEELKAAVLAEQAEVVIFNQELTPSQERNLEQLIKCRVMDRNRLILDIFSQRARTFEGKLQVELAQLKYLSTKLIRGWTHLERQKGGIGLRGPGETQLETDRRLLRNRIKTIHNRLAKVRSQRDQNRRSRRKFAIPTVSIVGYTNAGKSTLFNQLAGSDCFVADQLFATLDPTMRKIDLPGAGPAVLADTVGFIRDLPHDLIEAFSATLEETRDADLLLHVIDISNPNWRDNVKAVEQVLSDIQAIDLPMIYVYNKIDLMSETGPATPSFEHTESYKVWISAAKQQGLDLLLQAIANKLYGDPISRTLCLGPKDGKLRAELYRLEAVLNEKVAEDGSWLISIRLAKKDFERLFNINQTNIIQ